MFYPEKAISEALPAECWQRFARANSCQNAAEHKGSGPVRVKTAEYQGFLWTAFAGMYGPLGRRIAPYVDAWRLLPERLYTRQTTTYHDEAAIRRGERERGDHTGLIVLVNGERMVCSERVHFEMDLPTTRPIALAEAIAFDEQQRRGSWRALTFEDAEITWFSLSGHPVAEYRDERCCHAALFWRGERGRIEDLSITLEDFELRPALDATAEARGGAPTQFELF